MSASPEQGSRGVLLLGTDCVATRIVRRALYGRFGDVATVIETHVSAAQLLRRRMRTLGVTTVCGQVAFMAGVLPLLRRTAHRRITEICRAHDLADEPLPPDVHRVPSVNSRECRELLTRLDPAAVVVSGTRIIGRDTLRAVDAPFINMHAGITPLYRGVHGGYWAVADGRPDLAGVTVHLVDEGIDTGNVIAQARVEPGPDDSFVTYPYLQLAAGLPLLLDAVAAALDGTLRPAALQPDLPSRLRSHPTAWQYLHARVTRGAR